MGNDIKSPGRPEQHITGDRAVRVFEYRCSKRWVTNPSLNDYGWDILVTIEKEGKVKEDFLAQLKGSDNPDYINDGRIVSVELAVKTIMWLLNKSMPSMVSICDTGKSNEPVYFVWLQKDINRIISTNPKWHEQENVMVHIPVSQLLDENSHDGIENYVRKYYEDLKLKTALGDFIAPSIGIEKSESLSAFVNEQSKIASEKLSPLLKEAGLAEVTEKNDKIEIELFSEEDKNRFKQIKKISALLDEFRDNDAKVMLDKLEKEIENTSDGIKARYYNNKGVLELHLREFKNALDYFKKAHKLILDHHKYIINYLLAEYFIILPDDVYEKVNFSKEWVDKLEDVLSKNKDFPNAIRLKGLLLSNTKGAEAAEEYIKTTKIWHDENVTFRCELAENYKEEGNWDKAIELLSEIEESENDLYGPFWSLYGSILMYKAFGKKHRESKFIIYGPGPSQLDLVCLRKAEQCLLKACNKFSLSGFPLMSTTAVANLAMAQRILGRTDEAKHFCRAFLEKHPDNPEVASAMSGCFLASDEITSAAKYAKIAYQAHPHYKMTYQNYLICLSVLEDSEAVLELVAEKQSHGFSDVREEALSLSGEAIALNEIGRQDDAIKQIKKMKDNPNMIEDATVAEAVIARNNRTSNKEVADIYREGLKRNPESLILLTHFIHYLDVSNPEDAKELDESIRMIGQYRQLLPNEIYDLGFSNLTLNKINEGLRIFIEGGKRYSEESRFLYGQAVTHSKLGDEEKAYEALKKYIDLGKKNYNVLRNLAFLATETGRLDEAISIFQKALRKADDEEERGELNAQLWELRRNRGDPPKEILRHVLEFSKTIKDDPAQEARFLMMVFLSPVPVDEDEEITGWFAEFRKRLERFSENHPNFPQFRTFKIPKDLPDEEKGTHMLAQIAEVMLPYQLAATPFIISSRTRPYPLSFRAELMPGFSSTFDFWSNCVSSKDFTNGVHIWFDFNPRDVEFNCLSKRNEVCVDITTLLSLAELDKLDLLTKGFNIIYLARGTKRALNNELFRYRGPHPLAEKIEKWRLNNRSCIRVRNVVESEESMPDEDNEFDYQVSNQGLYIRTEKPIDKLIGDGVGESILLAKQMNIPLYSDDAGIRKLGLDSYNVNGFSTITLITKLRTEGHFKIRDETNILCEMIRKNYRVVPFDKNHLNCYMFELIEKAVENNESMPTKKEFLLDNDMGTLLRQFGDPFFNEDWLAKIATSWWISLLEKEDFDKNILVECLEYPSFAISTLPTSRVIEGIKKYEQESRIGHVFGYFLISCYEHKQQLIPGAWSAIKSCCEKIFSHDEEKYNITLFRAVPVWIIKEIEAMNIDNSQKMFRVINIPNQFPEEDRIRFENIFIKLRLKFMHI